MGRTKNIFPAPPPPCPFTQWTEKSIFEISPSIFPLLMIPLLPMLSRCVHVWNYYLLAGATVMHRNYHCLPIGRNGSCSWPTFYKFMSTRHQRRQCLIGEFSSATDRGKRQKLPSFDFPFLAFSVNASRSVLRVIILMLNVVCVSLFSLVERIIKKHLMWGREMRLNFLSTLRFSSTESLAFTFQLLANSIMNAGHFLQLSNQV